MGLVPEAEGGEGDAGGVWDDAAIAALCYAELVDGVGGCLGELRVERCGCGGGGGAEVFWEFADRLATRADLEG